jgi:hypothetical protein
MGKANKGQNIWFSRELIESKAYAALKTATAHRVLALFFTKRQFESVGRKGREQWSIKNNGQIEFTYKEALQKYGIPNSTFRNTIAELIGKGFIDIAAGGQGIYKVKNLYSVSDRWRKYGTPDYEQPQSRLKPINRGFQRDNQYGRNCCKEKKSTVAEQHSSTVTGQHNDNLGKESRVVGIT